MPTRSPCIGPWPTAEPTVPGDRGAPDSFPAMIPRVFVLLVMGLTMGSLFAEAPTFGVKGAQGDPLVEHIITRLELSREVAWNKFCRNERVRDSAREARVLAGLKSEGRSLGVTGEEVSRFFKPQIMASCRLQEELISGWRHGFPQPLAPPKDLQREIRPLLDKVTREMLLVWSSMPSSCFDIFYQAEAENMLRKHGFSDDIASMASRPLASPALRSP